MGDNDQVQQEETIDAGNDSAWMQRHLYDSIYIWACGEKADDKDDDTKLSDRLIGWLVLSMQAFAYAMLIVLARGNTSSDADSAGDDGDEPGYLLPSVTGAMYLLVASTIHDIRSGFTLMVDGSCAGHRLFGVSLLAVYGIMMSAAMTVLVLTSDDSASVVLNAVTVIFVADSDEKALKFLKTVAQKWRLFWAIESIGISFALALLAIIYFGDASHLLEEDNGILETLPSWFVWGVNPVAVTLCSVLLSSALQNVCDGLSDVCQVGREPTFRLMVSRSVKGIRTTMEKAGACFVERPCFYVAMGMWLAQAFACWYFMNQYDYGFPVAVYLNPTTPEATVAHMAITHNLFVLVYTNVLLATGLAMKAFAYCVKMRHRGDVVWAPHGSSQASGHTERWGNCADSSVSSLLVGWGLGYWSTSTMYLLLCSWPDGGCGWNDAPYIVTIMAYLVFPCFLLVATFIVADINILEKRFGAFVKPAVDILRSRGMFQFWVIASIFRDILVHWIWHDVALKFRVLNPW